MNTNDKIYINDVVMEEEKMEAESKSTKSTNKKK